MRSGSGPWRHHRRGLSPKRREEPFVATADVLDLDIERLDRTFAEMEDETLVFVMLGLLQPSMSGHPVTAGASVKAAQCARVAFTELAQRWIPLDVFGPAFKRLIEDGDDA
jgi:hypothetical protein